MSSALLFDPAAVRTHLIESARAGEPITYADLLARLGTRFTRPKMRALCKTLEAVDDIARGHGEPELAVLVVRQSDGLPGQGWWAGGHAIFLDHEGDWTGPEARRLINRLQRDAFDWWKARDIPR